MKILFTLILFIAIHSSTKAEYDSFIIQFQITTFSDSTFTGFTQVYSPQAPCNKKKDSLVFQEMFRMHEGVEYAYYASNMSCYEIYGDSPIRKVDKMHQINTQRKIASNEIKRIEVIDCIWETTMCSIIDDLKNKDWMDKQPVDIQCYSPFIEYCFYIHEWSNGLQEIIDEIVQLEEKYQSYGSNEKNTNAIKKLENRKVIVITCI